MPAYFHLADCLLFAALVLSSLVSFGLGCYFGSRTAPNYVWDEPTPDQHTALCESLRSCVQGIREDECVSRCEAVERHRDQAPAGQHAAIDECLRVLRVCRARWATQPSVVQEIAEGK